MISHRLEEATIMVGDICMQLKATGPEDAFELSGTYDSFRAPEPVPAGQPEITLDIVYRDPPPVEGAIEIFNTGSNWSLLRSEDHYYLPVSSPVLEPSLFKMLELDEDLARGRIYVADPIRDSHSGYDQAGRHCPVQYPLDEALMVFLLSRGRGVELHGLGVDLQGKGIVFTGTSGAGKSTLAGLWKEREDAVILSDDRLIVREGSPSLYSCSDDGASEDHFHVLYGTPWHGDAEVSAYGGVRLARILVLKQADENRLVELSPAAAATALLVRCFPTFWDACGMEYTMEFITGLCSTIPCFELRFRPEQAALDMALEDI